MTETNGLPSRTAIGTRVTVDGVDVDALCDNHLLDDVLVPLIEELASRSVGIRTFLFLVAPPGTGKSTLTALLLDRARHLDFDAVGIDGFHYPQAHLDTHWLDTSSGPVCLNAIKGAPETFDVVNLERHLRAPGTREVSWPVYDRIRHDVVEKAKPVRAGLVLVEGNWLLLDRPGWSGLSKYSVYNIFIDAEPDLLRDRLIARKVRGGLDPLSATDFYERSDLRNIQSVLEDTDRSKVDLFLRLNIDGSIDRGEAR
ncbi:hypothetical protein [Amycolatopsis sp. cmx-8-4]|uniref:hypothetical protein n=1 Tax=Amycolatopsis sp. cmx-8-4 TaxID=2790947 RepID=UPI00397E3C00